MACILAAGIVVTAEAISRQHEKRKMAKAAERQALATHKANESFARQIQGEVDEQLWCHRSSGGGEEDTLPPPYSVKDDHQRSSSSSNSIGRGYSLRPSLGTSSATSPEEALPKYEKVRLGIFVGTLHKSTWGSMWPGLQKSSTSTGRFKSQIRRLTS